MANDDPYRSGSLYNRIRALSIDCGVQAKNLTSTPVTKYKLDADIYREQQINHNQHIHSVLKDILDNLPELVRDEVRYLIEEEENGRGAGRS